MVWALYVAVLGGARSSRRQRSRCPGREGGWLLAHWVMVALVLVRERSSPLLLGCLLPVGFRKASRGMRTPLKKGFCRSLPVTVTERGCGDGQRRGCRGRHHLPGRTLARQFEGQIVSSLGTPARSSDRPAAPLPGKSREVDAKLYWVQFAANRTGWMRGVRAMLVLDGQRCVQGFPQGFRRNRVSRGCPPYPPPNPFPKETACGRFVRTLLWDPKLHSEGLGWLVAAVVRASAPSSSALGCWAVHLCVFGGVRMSCSSRGFAVERRTAGQYLKSFSA